MAVNPFTHEVHRDAGDNGSGALQRCGKDNARLGTLTDCWSAEKAWNYDLRCWIERPGSMPPADVATILAVQDAVEYDVVQTTAEELDLAQQIFYEIAEQTLEIVTRAIDWRGASGIDWCMWRCYRERQYRA